MARKANMFEFLSAESAFREFDEVRNGYCPQVETTFSNPNIISVDRPDEDVSGEKVRIKYAQKPKYNVKIF